MEIVVPLQQLGMRRLVGTEVRIIKALNEFI